MPGRYGNLPIDVAFECGILRFAQLTTVGDDHSYTKTARAPDCRRAAFRMVCAGVEGLPMEGIRSLLRGSLGRSLQALDEVDRLAAAWPVASGKAMAERAIVVGYADGVVRFEAVDEVWMREMMSMKGQLVREMGRIAGVPVKDMRIEIKRNGKR